MINEDNQKNNQNLELLPYKKNVSFKWEKLEFENEKKTSFYQMIWLLICGIKTLNCEKIYI